MHHPLAVDGRQRDDAEVDRVPADGQADAAVLRDRASRRCPGSPMIFRRETTPATIRRGIVRRVAQHAVDAEAHAHLAALGLEVDVGGALLDAPWRSRS